MNFQHYAGVGLVVSYIDLAIVFYVFAYMQLTYILLNETFLDNCFKCLKYLTISFVTEDTGAKVKLQSGILQLIHGDCD